MGVNRNVYVGAYLRITERVVVREPDRCAGHDRGKSTFCPECGRGEVDRYATETDAPTDDGFWDHEDWIDRLHAVHSPEPDGAHRTTIAKSNRGKGGTTYDKPGEWPMPDMMTTRSHDKFLAEHQRDVDRLRELGCTVTIEFGILAWCS